MDAANPIYDVVFKFMMEDTEVAKMVIGLIIGYEVESIEFRPQEYSSKAGIKNKKSGKAVKSLALLRLDFSALIITPEGKRHVIIEIQKSGLGTHTVRFRQYLGAQYRSEATVEKTKISRGRYLQRPIPIIPIYFVGGKLMHTTASIIAVKRYSQDLLNDKVLPEKEAFIEALSHDMFVVQIPYLTQRRDSDLALLLSLFDQAKAKAKNQHIIQVKEADYPSKFHHIIKRLNMAAQTSSIMEKMLVEDLMVREFEDAERLIEILTEEAATESKLRTKADKRAEAEAKLRAEADKRAEAETKRAEAETKLRAEADKRAEAETKLRAEADKRAEAETKRAEAEAKRAEELEQALIKLRKELMNKN